MKLIKCLSSFFVCLTLITLLSGCKGQSSSNKYIFATDIGYPPFEYQDNNEEWTGIDIELVKEIAKDQNFEAEFRHSEFNGAVAALEANQVDAISSGMIITEQRKNKYDFSDGYLNTGVVMAAKLGNDKINSLNDLRGQKVAIKTGTESGRVGASLAEKYGFVTKEFGDTSLMYEEIKTGNSVACFEDIPVLKYATSHGVELKIINEGIQSQSECGFAVIKGKNRKLLNMINSGLKNLKQNGKYYEILKKYLGEDYVQQQS